MRQRLSVRVTAGAAATVAAGAATAVVFLWPSGPGAQPTFAGSELLPPATTQVRTVELGGAPDADPRRKVELPARDTPAFSTVGITWTDPDAVLRGTAQVRTRATAGRAWSPWLSLTSAEPGADTPRDQVAGRVRGATEPQWVGPSDGVQVRVVAASGTVTDALPAGLRLELVDPGTPPGGRGGGTGGTGGGTFLAPGDPEPVTTDPGVPVDPPVETGQPAPATPESTVTDPPPTVEPTVTASPTPDSTPTTTGPTTTTPATPTSPVPSGSAPTPSASASASPTVSSSVPPPTRPSELTMPPVVSRLQWRADEKINRGAPSYGRTVRTVFVHHTADRKTYDCADSPAIIRGIHAYHVKSRGWSDIGYNFLVDRCGTLFEGRGGGVDRPVVGAHTYGFNTDNLGVAIIGTYSAAGVTPQVRSVVARLAAYRLGRYGIDPAGTVQLTSGVKGRFAKGAVVTMNRISGHRDADYTECPGTALYGQLGSVRAEAAQWVGGLVARPLAGGVVSGGTRYVRGAVTLAWTVGPRLALPQRFEILVDGRVTTSVAPTLRWATVRLTGGRHGVAVRAAYAGGRIATSASQPVVSDLTAPTFPRRPELALRAGTVAAGAVPVTLTWRAADDVRLGSIASTTPTRKGFAPTTPSWAATAAPGRATAWTVRAADVAGNASTAAVTRTPVLATENSAAKSGRWSARTNGGYLGGRALTSSARNASLTWTFTGRSAALVTARGATSGRVDVYVDGKRAATVDLRAAKGANRQAVWTRFWPAAGRHRVKIVVLGTAKRPGVTVDGLVYLR